MHAIITGVAPLRVGAGTANAVGVDACRLSVGFGRDGGLEGGRGWGSLSHGGEANEDGDDGKDLHVGDGEKCI